MNAENVEEDVAKKKGLLDRRLDCPRSFSLALANLQIILQRKKPLHEAIKEGYKLVGGWVPLLWKDGQRVLDPDEEKAIWRDDAFIGIWDEETKTFIRTCHSDYLDAYDQENLFAILMRNHVIDDSSSRVNNIEHQYEPKKDNNIEFNNLNYDPKEGMKVLKSILTIKQANVVFKVLVEKKDYKQISRELKISASSVSERYSTGIARIQKHLKNRTVKNEFLSEIEEKYEDKKNYLLIQAVDYSDPLEYEKRREESANAWFDEDDYEQDQGKRVMESKLGPSFKKYPLTELKKAGSHYQKKLKQELSDVQSVAEYLQ